MIIDKHIIWSENPMCANRLYVPFLIDRLLLKEIEFYQLEL